MAIASLIIGIVIIVTSFPALFHLFPRTWPLFLIYFLQLSPPIGMVGLAIGILALRRKARRRIAIAAIVLNSLVILFSIVLFVSLAKSL